MTHLTESRVREIVHEELASMGGDLVSTYGQAHPDDAHKLFERRNIFSAYGGYLLQRFGKKS